MSQVDDSMYRRKIHQQLQMRTARNSKAPIMLPDSGVVPRFDPNAKPTEKTLTPAEVKQMAHDYMVPISDGSVDEIAKGQPKHEAVLHFVKEQAKSLFPTWAEHIDNGIATAHIAQPYAEIKKQMLGPDATFDPHGDEKDRLALTGGRDDKGRPAPMTHDQWRNHIRTHTGYRWAHTEMAHQIAENFSREFHAQMGRSK